MTATAHTLTSLLPTREGALEYLLTGSGSPTTVFAHGLAGSIDTTRPFGGAVAGTRAFFHFRGHGASSSPESPWTYAALAGELRAVADHVGATRALGVSMGAGALCHWLAQQPDRFERVVLVIPAVLDTPRRDAALDRLLRMGELADERDVDGVTDLLLQEQPAAERERAAVIGWCRAQAETIVRTDVSRALRTIPHEVAMSSREALRRVDVPVLLIAQEEDPAHPVWVAEQAAGLLPRAELAVLPPGGILWRHRAQVRRMIGEFLSLRGDTCTD
ncbi:alpha/beta hydrolase [Luteipulveratus sp. YIM 133132]|uniref:Alpha/beta hydrolase n=1 Tax=Luteipulveratus flavus TaxID=3031728 RepID=A0ABT6C9I0_9MICO|nr:MULTISPECIES: alpha/beta hydrolase [unclassified Luteipulveratus]MDE9365535.1 alpha/beta hydrolase [Luteipulveratus sp. YIM 133132]MDF8265550.1 alpha/beta hydrolase [Luteipulveratus sp. YIM 133296]